MSARRIKQIQCSIIRGDQVEQQQQTATAAAAATAINCNSSSNSNNYNHSNRTTNNPNTNNNNNNIIIMNNNPSFNNVNNKHELPVVVIYMRLLCRKMCLVLCFIGVAKIQFRSGCKCSTHDVAKLSYA